MFNIHKKGTHAYVIYLSTCDVTRLTVLFASKYYDSSINQRVRKYVGCDTFDIEFEGNFEGHQLKILFKLITYILTSSRACVIYRYHICVIGCQTLL